MRMGSPSKLKWTAGISLVYGNVGLEDAAQVFHLAAGAKRRGNASGQAGDYSFGNGIREHAQGVADGDDRLAEFKFAGVTQPDNRQPFGIYLDDRNIVDRVTG